MSLTLMTSLTVFAPVIAYPATAESAIPQDNGTPDPWVQMTPTGARASFEMPRKPRYVEKSFTPIPGKPPIKVRLHLATAADGNITYVFSYHDLHAKPIDEKTANDALFWSVRGSYANVFGQLVNPQDLGWEENPQQIKQEGIVGRQFVCRFVQNEIPFILTGRVFLVEERLYQLNCIMAEEIYDAKLAAKFFGSFKLLAPEIDLPPRPRDSGVK